MEKDHLSEEEGIPQEILCALPGPSSVPRTPASIWRRTRSLLGSLQAWDVPSFMVV